MTQPDDLQEVMQQLSALAPTKADAPQSPRAALAQLHKHIDTHKPTTITIFRRFLTMSIVQRRSRAFSGLALVLLLVIAFSLPAVRAAASDFLGLFRVQKFAAISVSPQQLALLEEIADQGLYPGEFQSIQEPTPPQDVASLSEAAAITGNPVATATELGAPSQIQVSGAGSGRLIVDLDSARRIVQTAGADPQLLPDSLAGAEIDVTIFPAVKQRWPDGTTLVQSQSPLIDYPEDVDPDVLGEALLQVLGVPPQDAERLATTIDWSSTLLLPVPENLATFSEVTVNGASAISLNSVDGGESSLMWQQDGVIYVLAGQGDLTAIAESVE